MLPEARIIGELFHQTIKNKNESTRICALAQKAAISDQQRLLFERKYKFKFHLYFSNNIPRLFPSLRWGSHA